MSILFSLFFSLNVMADFVALEKALTGNKPLLAEKAYQELSESAQSNLVGQVLYGRLLFQLEKTQASYDWLEPLSENNPNNVDISYYFGRSAIVMAQKASIFSKLSYAKEALTLWQHALLLDPNHIKTLRGLISFHLGAPSIAGGDIEAALKYSVSLITLQPESGYVNLARVYWKKEQNTLAEKAINDGLIISPESEALYFAQGLAYMEQAENNQSLWGKARLSLNQALKYAKSDQDKQKLLYQLGKIAVKSGEKITEGINAIILLLTLEGQDYNEWGKYRLAQLYFNDNQLTKAQELAGLIDYQEDEDLKSAVKKLVKTIKKAFKSTLKSS